MAKLQLAQDPAADELLEENPLALLIAMLLDQQIPMEVAFAGPKKIADRIGGIDAHQIAEYDPDKFVALCSERPAIHRFPGSMAKRVQVLAQEIVDEYDGRAENIWKTGDPIPARYVVPDLERFNWRDDAAAAQEIPLGGVFTSAIYAVAWMGVYLIISMLIFRRRDFV